ncbi:MAG: protein kinase, partial [Gemmatimonadales bacterium]
MDVLTQLNSGLTGRYTVEREIGAGGMATVYLARDIRHDRRVALKLLKAELGAVLGVERFLSEIKVTANLQHPNLLPLFDSGEAAGLLFYVMPFVEGESLRARLEREKQLPVDEAVRITVAVASALDYA